MLTKKNRVIVPKREFYIEDENPQKTIGKIAKLGAAAAFCASASVLGITAFKHLKKNPVQVKMLKRKSKNESDQQN